MLSLYTPFDCLSSSSGSNKGTAQNVNVPLFTLGTDLFNAITVSKL
jgi:hypothetical protein